MPPKYKYEHVKEVLRKRIRGYPLGSKIPSTTKLRKEFGVSPQTINRAMSDLVDEGILERRPRRGTFVSRPGRSTRNLGFIWPAAMERLTKHPSAGTILRGVQAEAGARNRNLLVASNTDSSHLPFVEAEANHIAGVLILFNYDRHLVQGYIERGIPVVLIVPLVRAEGVPFVTSDHYLGTYGATMHLVKLGHRRIVHVTLDIANCIPVEEKIRGYNAAMHEAGLQETVYVYRGRAEPWNEADDAAFVTMLRNIEPTACCCFDDEVAAGITRICHERRIRVPDELSIVGYDDSSIVSHTWPRMTTVHVPLEEMGRKGVQMLDELIVEERLTGHGIVLPARLVERSSAKPLSPGRSQTMRAEKVSASRVVEDVVS